MAALAIYTPAAVAQIPAEGALGLSAFGIQSPHFQQAPCKRMTKIAMRQDTPAVAILFESFGKNNVCLYRFWDASYYLGKRHITQIHFTNEVGRRNNFMGKYGFQSQYNVREYNDLLESMPRWLEDKLRQRVRNILELIHYYSHTGTFILGAGLEDNYSQKAFNNLYRVLKSEWPYLISRNPVVESSSTVNALPREVLMEYHHYTNKNIRQPCILNGDGQDIAGDPGSRIHMSGLSAASDRSLKNWMYQGKKNGCVKFLWTAKWQGLHTNNTPLPHARKFKWDKKDVRRTSQLMRSMNRHALKKLRRKKRRRRK